MWQNLGRIDVSKGVTSQTHLGWAGFFLLEHHQLLGRIFLENLGKQKDYIFIHFFVWRNNEANLDTEGFFFLQNENMETFDGDLAFRRRGIAGWSLPFWSYGGLSIQQSEAIGQSDRLLVSSATDTARRSMVKIVTTLKWLPKWNRWSFQMP